MNYVIARPSSNYFTFLRKTLLIKKSIFIILRYRTKKIINYNKLFKQKQVPVRKN